MSEKEVERSLEILKKSQNEIEASQGEKLVSNPTFRKSYPLWSSF
jgi:hypothetical protein